MNFKYTAILVAAAIIVAFFFITFAGEKKGIPPTITIMEFPENVKTGEQVTVKVFAKDSKGVNKIVLKTQLGKNEENCGNLECVAIFTQIFNEPGAYEMELIAENISGKKVSQKIIVKVFDNSKICIDKTLAGECSKEKPFYCNGKKLVEKCAECGCPGGTKCILRNCVALSGKLEIASAQALPAPIIREKTGFKVKVSLINSKNTVIAKGAKYTLKAILTGTEISELEKNIELEKKLGQNETVETEFNFGGVQKGSYSVELELSSSEGLNDAFTLENFLDSSNDLTPPSKPTGLTASFNGGTLEIKWNPNSESDLGGYVLFKSNDFQPTHITYSRFKEFDYNTTKTEISGLDKGTHFFVLKAFDFLKNESDFSLNIKVEKR